MGTLANLFYWAKCMYVSIHTCVSIATLNLQNVVKRPTGIERQNDSQGYLVSNMYRSTPLQTSLVVN